MRLNQEPSVSQPIAQQTEADHYLFIAFTGVNSENLLKYHGIEQTLENSNRNSTIIQHFNNKKHYSNVNKNNKLLKHNPHIEIEHLPNSAFFFSFLAAQLP